MMEGEDSRSRRSPTEKEIKMPLSHRPSLNLPLPLLTGSKASDEASDH
jgi:hypothetical protein